MLARSEITLGPRAEDRFIVAFFGRTVANIEKMRMIGDRMPGASGGGPPLGPPELRISSVT